MQLLAGLLINMSWAECTCQVHVTTPSSVANSGNVGAAAMPYDLTNGTVSFTGRVDTFGDPPYPDGEGGLIYDDKCSWEISLSQDNANEPMVHTPQILNSPQTTSLQNPGVATTFNFSLKKGSWPSSGVTKNPARMRVSVVGKDEHGTIVASCSHSSEDSDVCAHPHDETSFAHGWHTKVGSRTLSLWLGRFEGHPDVGWEHRDWTNGFPPLTQQVRERSPGQGINQCHTVLKASGLPPAQGCALTGVTGGEWDLYPSNSSAPNFWGFSGGTPAQAPDGDGPKYDYMGLNEFCVNTYQNALRAVGNTGYCSLQISQAMDTECRPGVHPTNQWWVEVDSHVVIYGIKAPYPPSNGHIYLIRDNTVQQRNWP